MHSPWRRGFIDERIRQITLGYFSPKEARTHVYVSSLVKDTHALITQVHEEIHRDLTKRSELGFFQTLLGSLITFVDAPSSEVEKSYEILGLTIKNSQMAHESAAVYSSVIQAFGNSPNEFLVYMRDLPDEYKAACYKYCDILGWPTKGMDKIRISALSLLAGCISTAALNVPILAHFKSYARVSEESVSNFLKEHNPDVRQEEILMRLKDQKIQSHLLELAESFLREQTVRRSRVTDHDQKAIWMEQIEIARRLTETIGNKLQALMPEMVLWVPIGQHVKRLKAVSDRWRREWVSREYKNAELYEIAVYDGAEDAERKNLDLFLQHAVVEIPPGSTPFYQRQFAYLPTQRVREHIEAVRAIHGDLLVSVAYNVSEAAIELAPGVRREPGSLKFATCPWQWHGGDRLDSISEKVKDNVRAGPHFFFCPTKHAQEVIDALASLNTVWVRWLVGEEEMIRSGKKLPYFLGLSFICAEHCSIKKVIETCQQLAGKAGLTVFFSTASSKPSELVRQSIFLVAVLPGKATFYIFPVTYAMSGFIEEALKNTDAITFLEKEDEVKGLGNFDILNDIRFFFYGV